jgi:hypothetical protein
MKCIFARWLKAMWACGVMLSMFDVLACPSMFDVVWLVGASMFDTSQVRLILLSLSPSQDAMRICFLGQEASTSDTLRSLLPIVVVVVVAAVRRDVYTAGACLGDPVIGICCCCCRN